LLVLRESINIASRKRVVETEDLLEVESHG